MVGRGVRTDEAGTFACRVLSPSMRVAITIWIPVLLLLLRSSFFLADCVLRYHELLVTHSRSTQVVSIRIFTEIDDDSLIRFDTSFGCKLNDDNIVYSA